MLEAVIQDLTRQQRPYYLPQGNSVKGVGGQYWLVFQHRDAEKGGSFLKNIALLLGLKGKPATHKLIRIDPQQTARIYTYAPRKPGNIPSPALLRTASLKIIGEFLTLEYTTKEPSLLCGSFREIEDPKRRFSLPSQLAAYNKAIAQMLERCTMYFDSGVLKLYEEPLQTIVQTEGQIRLLIDWQGFTKRSDVTELEKLHNSSYRIHFIQNTLQEFLQGLEEDAFNGTQILAELVRLGFLEIKLIKMEQDHALYHKKTAIFSDRLDNHIMHEGSDNFTRAAHSRNAETTTFLYSWEQFDRDTIKQSIQEFDSEWQRQDIAFDLSQEFLHQVLKEYDRRAQQRQVHIEQITLDELPPGETTEVKITGDNLDKIDTITIPDNSLVEITITQQASEEITADFTVSPDHPPQAISDFSIIDKSGEERTFNPSSRFKSGKLKKFPTSMKSKASSKPLNLFYLDNTVHLMISFIG